MTTAKMSDDPICGEIRKSICKAYIAAGQPKPEKNWLYSRLVEARLAMAARESREKELAQALKHCQREIFSTYMDEKAENRVGSATKAWLAASRLLGKE